MMYGRLASVGGVEALLLLSGTDRALPSRTMS